MIQIGIDPGASGAVAIITRFELKAYPLPLMSNGEVDARELYLILTEAVGKQPHIVAIEKVGAMPGQGVSSTFSFGRNVGEIKAVLKVAKLSYVEVTPQAWKKVVLAGLPWKASGPADKKRAKLVAASYVEKRFPFSNIRGPKGGVKDGLADAICLALYSSQGLISNEEDLLK
jgi:crossover junction endodeoxyribonuclease RuvC